MNGDHDAPTLARPMDVGEEARRNEVLVALVDLGFACPREIGTNCVGIDPGIALDDDRLRESRLDESPSQSGQDEPGERKPSQMTLNECHRMTGPRHNPHLALARLELSPAQSTQSTESTAGNAYDACFYPLCAFLQSQFG